MDGAQASHPDPAVVPRERAPRVGGRGGRGAGRRASPTGTAAGADLGGSSKYSGEILEGQSGERFHVNSSWTWVSRS